MDLHELLHKASILPRKPGCYRMLTRNNQVIYVGKAKDLKSRVSSYFNKSLKNAKTEMLVTHILDFEFMTTSTEAEALVLENNLIKKHSPKYNIRLKDDKSYPYLVVDTKEPYPRLQYLRKIKKDKTRLIFGPFPTGSQIGVIIKLLTKLFKLRDCSLSEFKKRKEPCLLYQLEQCSAPCVKKISDEDYQKDLNLALALFQGHPKKTLKSLAERMEKSAEQESFEQAAMYRDAIRMIEEFLAHKTQQKNAEHHYAEINRDVIAVYQGEQEIDISLYMMRNGLLLGHKNFHFSLADCEQDLNSEILRFIMQYYSLTHDLLPDSICVDWDSDMKELFASALEEMTKKTIKVVAPDKHFKSLFELSHDQAKEEQRVRLNGDRSTHAGLEKLKDLLNLKERPVVLECFDVAVFQGSSPTASQIVFHDGKPDKKAYRHYTLEERPEGNNDFAMMREMLHRRLKKGNLPDVFIVDGGTGQVNAFLAVLQEHDLQVPVAGIAKAKNLKHKKTEERLIIPGRANPYLLANSRSLFQIVVQMRDEAHRFARKLHHLHESKRIIK
jgi:excinuclease ABC subunit C